MSYFDSNFSHNFYVVVFAHNWQTPFKENLIWFFQLTQFFPVFKFQLLPLTCLVGIFIKVDNFIANSMIQSGSETNQFLWQFEIEVNSF